MPRVDERLAITKGDYCIAIRFHARHFHPRRPNRHSRDREAAHTLGLGSKDALHVGDGNMALESHAVDEGGVARRKLRRQADPPLQCRAIGIVDDSDASSEGFANLLRPFDTASAARIAVHNRFGRRERRGCDQR